MKSKKVAIIHDWLAVNGGAEVVLKYLLQLFPKADIYTIIDTLPNEEREFLEGHKIYTSKLQKYSFLHKKYSYFMPIMPYLIEQFDLKEYDLVLSSSHFVAKGVLTHPDQLHISYIYSPMRYAWDLYFEYNKLGAFGSGLKNLYMKWWLHKIRIWDVISSCRPDYLIADSKFISRRIKKAWGKESKVIYPPVEIEKAKFSETKEDYFVTMSRLVEYKRVDLIIEAFNKMPDKKLFVIGTGREAKKLKELANKNITFMGYLPKERAMDIISKAKAFIFMAKEDFGIVPIEAQACGTPVIAFGEGGSRETVLENESGIFVKEQSSDSLIKAVNEFEKITISPLKCKEFAQKFQPKRFLEEIKEFITECEEKI